MADKILLIYNSKIKQIIIWLSGILILTSTIVPQVHLDESFNGHYREYSKTSIVRSVPSLHISRVRKYGTLDSLFMFLPKDVWMRDKYPILRMGNKDGPPNRVHEELFNVEVVGWVHAAKYEGSSDGDRDFHVILGNDSDLNVATFMNIEISGLPPENSNNYETLRNARKDFLDIFSDYNFNNTFKQVDLPRKVKIRGSIFFDGAHNHSCEKCPGPSYAKPGTVWEIHPIYSITLAH